jgi:N6-L-threonylcarbamoyladenine synthase
VGEAFDKVARRLGLGFPGGPQIEKLARQGVAGTYRLPRPMLSTREGPDDSGYFDFSFSGLKTAASLLIAELEQDGEAKLDEARPHVAAEFQEAVVDVLVTKTLRAVEHTGCHRVLLGGGVARNGPLRERLAAAIGPTGQMFAPSPRLSTDNAAMIARLAEYRLAAGQKHGLDLNADPALPFPGLS